MDDDFRSIDEPPDQSSEGTSAADFSTDAGLKPGADSFSISDPDSFAEPPADSFGASDPDSFGGPGPEPLGETTMQPLGAVEPPDSGPVMEPGFESMGEPGMEPGAEPGPAPEDKPPSSGDKTKSFISTPKGKLIAIGGLVGFLVVLGAVAFVLVSVLSGASTTEIQITATTLPPSTATSGTAGSSTTGTITAEAANTVGLPEAFEVFENKDPFRPLIVPVQTDTGSATATATVSGTTATGSTSSGSTSSGSTSSGSTSSGGTSGGGTSGGGGGGGNTDTSSLTLNSIASTDDGYAATFTYGGKRYTVHQGDVIDKSPWKVIHITSTSVTLLYGDEEIVLRLP